LPIAYGEGVIGLCTNAHVSHGEKEQMIRLLASLGSVVDCESEEDLDVITIISGSGPALVAYFISLLSKSGQAFGLEAKKAEKVYLQTVIGTLTLLEKTHQTSIELQNAVATKGGVTEQIIQSLDKEKIASRFLKSLEQGYVKIKKIEKSSSNSGLSGK